jgi:hypothetical protein
MPSVGQTASHIASSLIIFAVLVVLRGIIAVTATRKFGNGSRGRERRIFSLVGAICLLAAAAFTFLRLQARS